MSFYLARLGFIHPLRELIDRVAENDGMRYTFVEESVSIYNNERDVLICALGSAHAAFVNHTTTLPPFFRVAADLPKFARDADHLARV